MLTTPRAARDPSACRLDCGSWQALSSRHFHRFLVSYRRGFVIASRLLTQCEILAGPILRRNSRERRIRICP